VEELYDKTAQMWTNMEEDKKIQQLGPEAREDNYIHSGLKAATEGNGHPREDEECIGYEEPTGRDEGCID
jgi:hypothetical protein